MGQNIIAIVGSYRRGGITDQTVQEILKAVRDRGGQTEIVDLRDTPIEFCTNCRRCTQN